MDLVVLRDLCSRFYQDWFAQNSLFEGGTLVVKTPFYDRNMNEIKFRISEANNNQVKITLSHSLLKFIENSDMLLALAEQGGYSIAINPNSANASISKIVEPYTAVDAMHNFIQFFFCIQFMMELTAFIRMNDEAEEYNEAAALPENATIIEQDSFIVCEGEENEDDIGEEISYTVFTAPGSVPSNEESGDDAT